MKRVEINPGEMFAVSDQVVLVEEYETIIGRTSKLGSQEEDQIAYMFTFKGKLNNQDAEGDFTVAMSPVDAFHLADAILKGIELLQSRQNGENN